MSNSTRVGAADSDSLDMVRARIDGVDADVIALLAERLRLARRAGEAKRVRGLPVFDAAREADVLRRVATVAHEAGLPAESVLDLFGRIVDLCRGAQAQDA